MKIEFADPAVGELFEKYDPEDAKDGLKKYIQRKSRGECSAEEVARCLNVLEVANNPSEILSMYNYHLLKHDKTGCAAINIISRGKGKKGGRGKWRILFKPISSCGDINKESSIKKIVIIDIIINYHKNRGR